MNPKNNNSLQNPFAANNAAGAPGATPSNLGAMSMSDSLASAEDNLTSAGMAAGPVAGGAMGLDQIASADAGSPALPYIDEPLVPAAPVPGSIGSAISMPPADPAVAPFSPSPATAPVTPATSPVTPTASTMPPASGAMSAPEVAPTPYNPFAPSAPSDTQATPALNTPTAPELPPAPTAPNAPATPVEFGTIEDNPPTPTDPSKATQPNTPSTATSTTTSTTTPTATSSSAHTAPAVQPMPVAALPTKKTSAFLNPVSLILAVVVVILLAVSITLFIFWNNEKKQLKPIYYPQVSETSTSVLKSISCQRAETRENPTGSGTNTVTLGFTNGELSAYSSNLSLDFANEADVATTRDANAAAFDALASSISGTLAATTLTNSNNYSVTITSGDGKVAPSDAQNVIYGTTEGNPSLTLSDIQAKYEADGYVCTEE